MTGYPWTAWLFWSGGATVGLLGLWLLYWSLLKDRAKGRRRCPKCWYNLSATKSMRCSECGHEAKIEKKLLKTKRCWRWATVAIIIVLISSGSLITPKIQRDRWVSFVPTSILIRLSPLGDDWDNLYDWRSDIIYELLYERVDEDNFNGNVLTESQWDLLVDVCSTTFSKNVTKAVTAEEKDQLEWTAAYEFLVEAFESKAIERNDRMKILASRLPVEVELFPNDVWPSDVPVYWHAKLKPMWWAPSRYRLSLLSESKASFPLPDHFYEVSTSETSIDYDGNLEIVVPQGAHTISFDLLVEINTDFLTMDGDEWIPYQRLHIDHKLTVAGEVSETLKPITKPEISYEIRDCVKDVDLMFINYNERYPILYISFANECPVTMPQLVAGLEIEVMRNKIVLARGITSIASKLPNFHFELECNPEDLRQNDPELDQWEIRVHGYGPEAYRARKKGKYWAGEFTIDVDWTEILYHAENEWHD